jgi:hypothetical protein
LNKANATDEAEQGEPDLDILVKLAPRQSRLDAIQAAKTRLQERQQQADMARGRTSDDERRPSVLPPRILGLHCEIQVVTR